MKRLKQVGRATSSSETLRFVRKLQDDIHGEIFLTPLERHVIDTPEFQRLFHISQLGFIKYIFRTADHTRGAHSIGCCAMAQHLVEKLNVNTKRISTQATDSPAPSELLGSTIQASSQMTQPPTISPCETELIRLGALLHDIAHGPFSHDIEQKRHYIIPYEGSSDTPHQFSDGERIKVKSYYAQYPKHDDFRNNPTLFLAIMDRGISVLARVLREYSPGFWDRMRRDAQSYDHIDRFVTGINDSSWKSVKWEILPSLLLHLLLFDDLDDAAKEAQLRIAVAFADDGTPIRRTWGLGPENSRRSLHHIWYQPYRYDIIGNTLSADLIDYLLRDPVSLGISRGIDLNLLNFYVLAPLDSDPRIGPLFDSRVLYRTAIDLNDYKRGTIRMELVNDLFRLLDLRHEIHEKAVSHRIVQSSIAMLSRTILALGEDRPSPKELSGLYSDCPPLCGDDYLLARLITLSQGEDRSRSRRGMAVSLSQKLAERRMYKPLIIIPGDRALELLDIEIDSDSGPKRAEKPLRKFAAIVDSSFFAPYFLFISLCVEKLLQHYFRDEDHVDERIHYVINELKRSPNSRFVERIMNVLPKRVIIWTTPYKQLYKDPTLLVRADNVVAPLDKFREGESSTSLSLRVKEAMRDADIKYAGLWKLYVFLSDGLFYSGVLSKIHEDHPCFKDYTKHKGHLETAQKMLIRAFRVAWKWWGTEPESKLNDPMQPSDFASLLADFRAHRKVQEQEHSYRTLHRSVSAVALEQYLHGPSRDECSDVRYKFDPLSEKTWNEARKHPNSKEARAVQILTSLGLSKKRLTRLEFLDFVDRMEALPDDLVEDLDAAAREEELVNPDQIRSLWGDGLPWTDD